MVLTQLTKPARYPFSVPPYNSGQSRSLHRADAVGTCIPTSSIPSQHAQAAAGLDVVFERIWRGS